MIREGTPASRHIHRFQAFLHGGLTISVSLILQRHFVMIPVCDGPDDTSPREVGSAGRMAVEATADGLDRVGPGLG